MHLTILLFHASVPCSKLIKKQANIMVQRCQKCYRGTYFNDVIYIAVFYCLGKVSIVWANSVVLSIAERRCRID